MESQKYDKKDFNYPQLMSYKDSKGFISVILANGLRLDSEGREYLTGTLVYTEVPECYADYREIGYYSESWTATGYKYYRGYIQISN